MKFFRLMGVGAIALAAGCATMSDPSPHASFDDPLDEDAIEAPQPGRYVAEPGFTAQRVAELRAEPPAPAAEILPGANPHGDVIVQRGQGYVRVGLGYYDLSYNDVDNNVESWVASRAQEVGADRILRYESAPARTPPPKDPREFAGDTTAGSSFESTAKANDEQPIEAVEPERSLVAAYFVKFKPPFGASFRDLNANELAQFGGHGVWIGAVIGNSPADEANLAAGDVVLAVDGEAVRDRASFQQTLRARAGHAVSLSLSRNGQPLTRVVRLGKLPGDEAR